MTEDQKLLLFVLLAVAFVFLIARYPAILLVFAGKATARCRDGSFSFSRERCGTCSHHGGVSKFLPV